MTDLDPAAIMAEHPKDHAWSGSSFVDWCAACNKRWPCLPYRLAAALAEAQERERRVRARARYDMAVEVLRDLAPMITIAEARGYLQQRLGHLLADRDRLDGPQGGAT